MRGLGLGVVLVVGCAGRGEAVATKSEPAPERMRFGMCVGSGARSTERHPAIERGAGLFRQAAADYEARRDEAAARGYLAAGAAFHEAVVADPRLAVARVDLRVAHANAALAWLMARRVDEARAALALAATRDEPTMQARWQREIAELPHPPDCSFPRERAAKPVVAEPVAPAAENEPAESEPAAVEPAACGAVDRGEARRGHAYVGATVAALVERGGAVLCGQDPLWQLRFGTLCGDIASFHAVVTVEVKAGKVVRVWEREQHNAGFCDAEL